MGAIEDRIKELGYDLPGAVVHVTGAGLVYTSGHVAKRADGSTVVGKLGADISIEDAYEAVQLMALSILGTLKATIVKLLCMVNSTPDFGQQPPVANGASDLIVEVFGEKGQHARSAVGMADLPGGACVEIELIAEVSS